MKLLIVTQVVDRNDPVLGFFHRWIEEFASRVDSIEVICLKKGVYDFPKNVRVHSLGKEKGRMSRSIYAIRFLRLTWKLRDSYDSVFVHMNAEYISIAGVLWKMLRKRIALWYVHKTVSFALRIATVFADVVMTASSESFRLSTPKLRIMGHGIEFPYARKKSSEGPCVITSVSRVSPTKRIYEMIHALPGVVSAGIDCSLHIVGAPVTRTDKEYASVLSQVIASSPYHERIVLVGPVTHDEAQKRIAESSVLINLSATGSLDKAVLEALGVGVPVVTSNEAFKDMLEPLGLYVRTLDPDVISSALVRARDVNLGTLPEQIQRQHSLSRLIPAILLELEHDVPEAGR